MPSVGKNSKTPDDIDIDFDARRTAEVAELRARRAASVASGNWIEFDKGDIAPLNADIEGTIARWQARCSAEYAEYEREQLRKYQAEHPVEDDPVPTPRKPRDPDGLLDADQAAARLNITKAQLIAHVEDGALRYINVGRGAKRPRYRFRLDDITDFESNRTMQGNNTPCLSSKQQSPRRTSGTASTSNVVGFLAQRAARLGRKPRK